MAKERKITEEEIKKYNRKNRGKITGGTTSKKDGITFTFVDPDEKATKKAKKLEEQAAGLIGYKEPVKKKDGGEVNGKKKKPKRKLPATTAAMVRPRGLEMGVQSLSPAQKRKVKKITETLNPIGTAGARIARRSIDRAAIKGFTRAKQKKNA